jgi:hypothetical protein
MLSRFLFVFFLVSRLDLEFIQTLQEQTHRKKWLATVVELSTKKKDEIFHNRCADLRRKQDRDKIL